MKLAGLQNFLELPDKDVKKLIFDFGMEFVHSKYLSRIMPKPEIDHLNMLSCVKKRNHSGCFKYSY
jgi:hypothetical protein